MSEEERTLYEKRLKKYYNYDSLKDLQFEIISNVMNYKDTIALLPTSYGKSICYQLPYLLTKKCVIVVSPLISLMDDQVSALEKLKIPVVALNSKNNNKYNDMSDILKGKNKIIYTTPEFLAGNKDFIERLDSNKQLCVIAIDECHCISMWGHSFRNDYRELVYLKDVVKHAPILALTATATEKVIIDVAKNLKMKEPSIVKYSIDRTNLYIEIKRKDKQCLDLQIVPLINEHYKQYPDDKILIYCKTTSDCDKLAESLNEMGFKCESYHAKKTPKERTDIQKEYTNNTISMIVSTIAFGMGVNIPNIRTLIHYNSSSDIESYMQEIGRAGRDNKMSNCYMFYSDKDFMLNFLFAEQIMDDKAKKQKYADIEYLKKYVISSDCRRKVLLKYFDETMEKCGNCDNCKTSDTKYIKNYALEAAIIFNMVRKVSLGASNLILLAIGSNNKKIANHKNTVGQCFGAGDHYDSDWWKSFIEILIENEYLGTKKIKINNFPMSLLELTKKSSAWLMTKNELNLSVPKEFYNTKDKLTIQREEIKKIEKKMIN